MGCLPECLAPDWAKHEHSNRTSPYCYDDRTRSVVGTGCINTKSTANPVYSREGRLSFVLERLLLFIDMCLRVMQIYAAHKYKFSLVYNLALQNPPVVIALNMSPGGWGEEVSAVWTLTGVGCCH